MFGTGPTTDGDTVTLIEKQQLFTALVSRFIAEIIHRGYGATFGETYRPPEMAKIYHERGSGIEFSLHEIRLAIDLNLFVSGKFLTLTEQYTEAGKLWESYSTQEYTCAWGGRFTDRPDGNHFSLQHNGVR